MNPIFMQLYNEDRASFVSDVSPYRVENPATAHDRALIAKQEPPISEEMLMYDRPPIAGEWAVATPQDAIVRVYVINEWTTVRVLQNASGERLAEPVIDSWHPVLTPVAAA